SNTDNKVVKNYFQEIFPSLDEERVYQSDLKKMLKWYPQLKHADLLKFEEEKKEEEVRVEASAEMANKEVVEETKKETKEKDKEKESGKNREKKATSKKTALGTKMPIPKEKPSDTTKRTHSKKG
ncbi:MAG: hypothetical protein ACRDE2_15670, partial [Chitinophagaceae bacterium]